MAAAVVQPPPFFNPDLKGPRFGDGAGPVAGMGTVASMGAAVTSAATMLICGDQTAQPATGHSPSSDVVSMMRPSATQAAP